ncbi:hypothetical protein ABFY60_14805 [Lysinibacillus pakistanensis]|uniref:hypothetical protein n=1 Tax=Lysinibacillus pakistanensis TaxID=759811 RepID=UPI003D2A6497
MKIIDTESAESIVNSLCDVFNISMVELQNLYITDKPFEFLTNDFEDISLSSFYALLESVENRDDLKKYTDDLYITSFHLSKRTKPIEVNEKLLNLHSALLNETDLKHFFEKNDITFLKEGSKLKCLYKGQVLDWKKFHRTKHENVARLIESRLEGNKFFNSDNCINGFLFSHNIVNQHNVEHLSVSPEIVQNILKILGLEEVIQQFDTEYRYIIKYRVKFNDFIFDSMANITIEEKMEKLLKMLLQYLANSLTNQETTLWNPMVRATDDLDVEPSDVCKFELVSM